MQELIKVTEREGQQVVSARNLHEFLEVKTDLVLWCKRMFEYGFQENEDYVTLKSENPVNQQVITSDYVLKIDCAKEISMLQRSEKGKQARRYFIECEKKLNQLQPKTFAEALRLTADQAEALEEAKQEIQRLEEANDISEQWISIKRAAKDYGVSETSFKWRELKKFSINNGIEIKKAPCPRYGTMNLYHISTFKQCYPILTHSYTSTKTLNI